MQNSYTGMDAGSSFASFRFMALREDKKARDVSRELYAGTKARLKEHVPKQDIAVIGASAGGVEALQVLTAGLLSDLKAAWECGERDRFCPSIAVGARFGSFAPSRGIPNFPRLLPMR